MATKKYKKYNLNKYQKYNTYKYQKCNSIFAEYITYVYDVRLRTTRIK